MKLVYLFKIYKGRCRLYVNDLCVMSSFTSKTFQLFTDRALQEYSQYYVYYLTFGWDYAYKPYLQIYIKKEKEKEND